MKAWPENPKPKPKPDRRRFVLDCPTCATIQSVYRGFGPLHDASSRCESGRYEHCSCDRCF